jgi:hypothetical protein
VHDREGNPGTVASFLLLCANCPDETELFRAIVKNIICIETHEAREAFRVVPTYWAPFHPHNEDGMFRWGDVQGDMFFGLA